jgi:hypothetical protein
VVKWVVKALHARRGGLVISFDLAYELTLGVVCAALRPDPREPVTRLTLAEPAFREGFVVSAVLYVPSAMAALALGPAWQTMYLLDFVPTTPWLVLIGAVQTVALVGVYVLGFLLGARVIAAQRGRPFAVALAVGWALLLATILGVLWRRAFTLTTYADFWTPGRPFTIAWGAEDSLLGTPLMKVLVGAGLANVAALVALTRHLRGARGPGASPSPTTPASPSLGSRPQ